MLGKEQRCQAVGCQKDADAWDDGELFVLSARGFTVQVWLCPDHANTAERNGMVKAFPNDPLKECVTCGHPKSWHDMGGRCFGDPRYKGCCSSRCNKFKKGKS